MTCLHGATYDANTNFTNVVSSQGANFDPAAAGMTLVAAAIPLPASLPLLASACALFITVRRRHTA